MSFFSRLFGPPDIAALKAEGDVRGLISALGYPKDAGVRASAKEALVSLGTPSIEELVLELSNPSVAEVAAEVLDRIGYHPSKTETGATYWIARKQWGKAGEIGPPAVAPLISVFGRKDIDETTFQEVGRALVSIGNPTIDPLITALGDKRLSQGAISVLNQSQGGIYMDKNTNPGAFDCHPERSEGSGEGRGKRPTPDASPQRLAQHDIFGAMTSQGRQGHAICL